MRRETESLESLDSFPYRHRVFEVMSAPIAMMPRTADLVEASRVMAEKGISSIIVTDMDAPVGILTERDVLRVVARSGSIGLHMPLSAIMSSPVITVNEEALVFVAMGRMEHLNLRHLLVTDRHHNPVGVITSRGLLKLRVGSGLALGDEIGSAPSPEELKAARSLLPSLSEKLMAEDVGATDIAGIVTSALCDTTARAAELSEASMIEDGWGAAPTKYCVLVLGSGGRGESLFSADQDNAIVHLGTDQDTAWFAELGRRLCALLAEAGVPLCKGGVMASNETWCRSYDAWRKAIDRWVSEANGDDILNVDIFIDFKAVHGSLDLADGLRDHLLTKGARSSQFLHILAASSADMKVPLGLFGQFVTQEGRIDVKLHGMMPLVGAVRVLALKHKVAATATSERLAGLAEGGHLPAGEAKSLAALHHFLLGLMVRQQLACIKAGTAPSNKIDPSTLTNDERKLLKAGFKQVKALTWVLENALSSV
ncbi:MAG: CBS domain-containing protein [Alphaproteobacteria bacterium]|nr:CBS domain-containing protein [Alphaproteobacteria bacterium]